MYNYVNNTAAQKQRYPRRLNKVREDKMIRCAYDLV